MNPSNNPTPVRPDAQARRTPPPPPPLAVAPPPPPAPAPPPAPSAPRAPETPQSTIEQMVREAHAASASDIHIRVGQVPRFRIRGVMQVATSNPKVTPEIFEHYLAEILTPEQRKQFAETKELDTAIFYPGFVRCRVNCFDSLSGGAIVLRLISLEIPTIDALRLPEVLKSVILRSQGLILITGPTGSGKSTTLAAMIDYINNEMPKHIITIEDPIEFVHFSKRALIRHREVGANTLKFDNALKASLREDPDIILVGEMRDKETVNTALKAAQTGHLVMGTLHTNSAVKTIERILQLYEPEQQVPMRVSIAESLVAVISQGLCRTTDGKRAAFHDIMINTDAIRDYIRRGDIDEINALIPRCNFDGMCTMNQSLFKLYEAGRITEETALENSPTPNEMAQMLRGRV